MAGLTNYTEELVLDYILTLSPDYVAFYTDVPDDLGAGTEVSGGAYARQAVTFARSGSVLSNTSVITFPESTAPWGTIISAAIHDAVTGGTMLASGPLDASKVVGTGETITYPVGTLQIPID